MMWGNGDWNGGLWVAMIGMMLVFWGVVIAFAVWAVRAVRGGRINPPGVSRPTGTNPPTSQRAEELLAERFARGEIDEAQFTRGRALLHHPAGSAPSHADTKG